MSAEHVSLESIRGAARVAPALKVRARAGSILVAYVLVFFVVLPWILWQLGTRFDAWFELGAVSLTIREAAAIPTLVGLVLMAQTARQLWTQGRGLPVSHLAPSMLVASGVFAHMRHPLYVGYTLAFAGVGLAVGSWGQGLCAPSLLTLAWLAYATGLEEPRLLDRFGRAYADYRRNAPLLPSPFHRQVNKLALRAYTACLPWIERVANRTVLFRLGPTVWVAYGAWLALGAAVSAALAPALLGGRLPAPLVDEYVIGLTLSMVVGGRVAWLFYEQRALVRNPLATLRRVGFVSFGAYAAMIAFAAFWSEAHQLDALWLIDRTVLCCSLSSGFGRLGCLSYGCCYGRTSAYGVSWQHPGAKMVREQGAAGHAPRLPVQLFAAGWAFAVFGLSLSLLHVTSVSGVAAGLTLLCYSLGRFGLESLRDEIRLLNGRFTRGQLLSMLLVATTVAGLLFIPAKAVADEDVNLRWESVETHLVTFLTVALMVFVTTGYHRKKIGQW